MKRFRWSVRTKIALAGLVIVTLVGINSWLSWFIGYSVVRTAEVQNMSAQPVHVLFVRVDSGEIIANQQLGPSQVIEPQVYVGNSSSSFWSTRYVVVVSDANRSSSCMVFSGEDIERSPQEHGVVRVRLAW